MTNIAFKQAHSGNYRRAARGKEDIRYLVIHLSLIHIFCVSSAQRIA